MSLIQGLMEMMTGAKIYSAKDFNFRNNQFTTFASDLGKDREFLGPIFDDAADIGFFVRSTKTGKLACYSFDESEGPKRDAEGDIQFWELKPVKRHPSMLHNNEIADFATYSNTKVVVFNT